jgi:hypothetical protein
MRTGTSHFVSKRAAVKYYKPYEDNPLEAVEYKIETGEITIGKPPAHSLGVGESLVIIDDGTRYAIQHA